MSESRTKNVIRNTGAGIGVRLLTLLLNFVLKTVFIKVLGIQYTGVSSLFTDVLTILSFAELGIGSAITYALYKPVAENDELQIIKLMNFYRKAYRLVAITVFAVGFALAPFLGFFVKDVPDIKESITVIYVLYLVNTASSYLLIYKSAILVAKQKKYVISAIEGISSMLRLVIESILIVIYRQFILYMLVEILFTILQNFLIGIRADKEYQFEKLEKKAKLDNGEVRKILTDVQALAMYQISGVVLAGTDSVVISAFLGTSLVGYISYYKLIVNQIARILIQFFDAMNPSVGNMAVQGDSGKQYTLFKKTNFAIFWLLCICCTGLVVCLNPLVEVWLGEEYVLPMSIVIVLTADFFVTNMIRIVAVFRTSNGLFVQGKYRPVIMAVINVVLSVVLVRPFGMLGVLLATVMSRLLTQVWFDPWLVYRNVFNKDKAKSGVWEYYGVYIGYVLTITVSAAISMFAADCVAELLPKANGMLALIILAILCVVISTVVVLVLWGRSEDCREVMAWAKSAGKTVMKKLSKNRETR